MCVPVYHVPCLPERGEWPEMNGLAIGHEREVHCSLRPGWGLCPQPSCIVAHSGVFLCLEDANTIAIMTASYGSGHSDFICIFWSKSENIKYPPFYGKIADTQEAGCPALDFHLQLIQLLLCHRGTRRMSCEDVEHWPE